MMDRPLIERLYDRTHPQPPFDLGYTRPFWTPESEPQQATEPKLAETEPLPPVIEPPQRDLRKETLELCAPVLAYLQEFTVVQPLDLAELAFTNPLATTELQPPTPSAEQKEFETRKAALEADLRGFADRLAAFLTAHRDWRVVSLKKEYEAAWRAARAQHAVVAGIEAEASQALGQKRGLITARSASRVAFEAHDAKKPRPDSFPSRRDLEVWQAENTRLRAAWEKDNAAVEEESTRQRDLARQLAREGTTLSRLRARERKLRAQLGGEDLSGMGLTQPSEL